MVCAIGGLQKCAKFGCSGDTFGGLYLHTTATTDIILFLLVYCCFYLHSNASSGILLHILHTYAIFVYFAHVPSHALGA